ncbi:MAG: hypothetical protein M1831_006959 [Alyxoria varia]|nr:MAG: hypothetical protein M1831_006959 [Alyxoria varia]
MVGTRSTTPEPSDDISKYTTYVRRARVYGTPDTIMVHQPSTWTPQTCGLDRGRDGYDPVSRSQTSTDITRDATPQQWTEVGQASEQDKAALEQSFLRHTRIPKGNDELECLVARTERRNQMQQNLPASSEGRESSSLNPRNVSPSPKQPRDTPKTSMHAPRADEFLDSFYFRAHAPRESA